MNDLHTLLTVVFFLLFVGIVAMTYSRGQKAKMDEAAQIPLQDDAPADHQTVVSQTPPADPKKS